MPCSSLQGELRRGFNEQTPQASSFDSAHNTVSPSTSATALVTISSAGEATTTVLTQDKAGRAVFLAKMW